MELLTSPLYVCMESKILKTDAVSTHLKWHEKKGDIACKDVIVVKRQDVIKLKPYHQELIVHEGDLKSKIDKKAWTY